MEVGPVRPASEEAWLVRVMVNVRRDQWRKAAVRTRMAPILSGDANAEDANQETTLIAKRTIWRALDVLSPRRRAIVVMHELEDVPITTIATQLGISAITVRWHLSIARRELTGILKAHMGATR